MPAKKPKTAAAKAQTKNGRKRAAPPDESQPPTLESVKTGDSEEDMQGSNVEDSAAVLANATKDELEKYVQKLMKHITMLRGSINVIEKDGLYKRGFYNHWTRVGVHMWEDDMRGFVAGIFNWTMNHGIRVTDGRPDKVLSKEQKRQLILSMDGWVVQESFDSIVSRLPRSPRILLLQYFMQILILKDIWRRFWRNPFWYLEPALAPDSADPDSKNAPGFDTVAPFGEDVSRLYREFQRADLELAHHWRAQTVRLANTDINYNGRNGAFHAKNLAIREAKAAEFARAKYADPSFQCLLRESESEFDLREKNLISHYQRFAELAVKIAAAQPAMEWLVLKDVPATFERTSHQITTVSSHHLFDKERRLNGHRVLAVVSPALWKTGTWLESGKSSIIHKGEVIVEDLEGLPPPHYWTPGEARAKRKKAKEEKEKAKVEETGGADEKESSPEDQARKRVKTRT